MLIGLADCAPVVGGFEDASGRVDHFLSPEGVDQPLVGQLVDVVEVVVFGGDVETTLVLLVEVVNDVEKLGVVEHFPEVLVLRIGTHQSAEPVVRHHQSRDPS